VTTDLYQSRYISVLSEPRLYDILSDLGQLEAQNYSSDTLEEVAARGNVNHILTGSFTRAGDITRMSVTLHDAATGEVIASHQLAGTGDEGFYTMVDELTPWIKSRFALSRSVIASDIDRRVGEITTAQPEALKFYVEGRKLHMDQDYRESIASMEKAVALDPGFAMAYRSMAMSYGNLRMRNERGEYIRKAMALAERLPERERLQIEGDFYNESEETYDKAIEAFERLLELYPDALNAYNNLGLLYDNMGETQTAIHWYEESMRHGDSSLIVYTNLSDGYRRADQYDKAEELLRSYLRDYSDDPRIYRDLSLQYIHTGELDRAQAELDKAFLLDPTNYANFQRQGDILRFRGELAGAEAEYRKLFELREPLARIIGTFGIISLHYQKGQYTDVLTTWNDLREFILGFNQPRWNARGHIGISGLYLRTHRSREAIQEAEEAFAAAAGINYRPYMQEALFLKCLAYTQMNALPDAERTAAELKTLVDEGKNRSAIRWFYHASGEIALRKGNRARAIELFRQSIALLEYGPLAQSAFHLEPLARAYFESGEMENAKKEYEHISRLTSGRATDSDIFAKSFYMLGRIYEQQEERENAIEHYERFLELWKNADPGLVEVEDAKARLAALRQ
jgi:tetratricopeptide (TPR) repeat protein/TolB-like protein